MGCLILEGFMGCGKTTCGRILAKELMIDFLDTDREIERITDMRIPEIFAARGEEEFREEETALLRSLAERNSKEDWVLALGGGMPVRAENRALLREIGEIVYLKASPGLLKERLRNRRANRPLLMEEDPDSTIDRLMREREQIYLDLADYIVETDGKDIDRVVTELKLILHHRRKSRRAGEGGEKS